MTALRLFSHPRYPEFLLGAFGLVWLALAWRPVAPFYWWLENALVIPFILLLVLRRKRFPLSHVSYTFIWIFLVLHEIGAHYSYIYVPIDWSAFGAERNHYDRVVHFAFGLLMAYPIREVFLRVAKVRGVWGFYLPFDVTLSFSAAYEILEWGSSVTFGGSADLAFVGAQGDQWDAVKDMAIAGLGALIAMATTFLIAWRKNPRFRDELRPPPRDPDDEPLGEVRMRRWKEWKRQRQT